MSAPSLYTSPANSFLQEEVHKLGSSPGIRSLPPGPPRDFLVLTWGPVVYLTSYNTESKRLLPSLLRCLNGAVQTSIHRNLTGSDELLERLEAAYESKVFKSRDLYDGIDANSVREEFRAFKLSLALPTTGLPGRMRMCLMADEEVFSRSSSALSKYKTDGEMPDPAKVWVKLVEENFPDERFEKQYYVTNPNDDGSGRNEEYEGVTMISLLALVEVFDGLRQKKYLAEYHRKGKAYVGQGEWHEL